MIKKKPHNCLIISSRPPMHSAGLGQDMITALEQQGIEVDFLTRYKDKSDKSTIFGIRQMPKNKVLGISTKSIIYRVTRKIFRLIKPSKSPYIINNGIEIKYIDERRPTIEINEILSNIKKKYDLIITLFWQDMINSSTLKAIYDIQKCPIMVYSPDMAPMTGGCFYFGKCNRYTLGCGKCPGFGSSSEDDQSKINLQIKKCNYESSNIAFIGNTWMLNHFRSSYLSGTCRLFNIGIVIDEEKFYPYDKSLRLKRKKTLDIEEGEFVIMIRSTQDIRKGNNDIYESLEILLKKYQGNRKIRVITVGNSYFKNKARKSNISVIDFGQISMHKLIELYNVSDVFVSASIDDAGPSMINQSIMCGTPVISYNTGVAIDIIKDGESGFQIEKGNTLEMANKLMRIILMSYDEYTQLRETTRYIGYNNNSKEHFAKKIISAYNDMI